jgi:hypothetical protein
MSVSSSIHLSKPAHPPTRCAHPPTPSARPPTHLPHPPTYRAHPPFRPLCPPTHPFCPPTHPRTSSSGSIPIASGQKSARYCSARRGPRTDARTNATLYECRSCVRPASTATSQPASHCNYLWEHSDPPYCHAPQARWPPNRFATLNTHMQAAPLAPIRPFFCPSSQLFPAVWSGLQAPGLLLRPHPRAAAHAGPLAAAS